jgi:hypothetical protein
MSGPLCVLFRDSLMTALMCLAPLRRKNLAEIVIGTRLFIDGDVVRLNFEGTKTIALIATTLPCYMQRYITSYLTRYREFLRRGRPRVRSHAPVGVRVPDHRA